jgi:acyl transferase domain-containing protein/phosphopantetheinyl transferase
MGHEKTTPPEQDIAIIGMACMFPDAHDLETYWANIVGKVDSVGEPGDSWGAERYYDPESNSGDRIYTKAGGFLRDLYRFNCAEFGIMPSSVDGGEPDQFLALKVAHDALLDAGCLGEQVDHTNTGIILGHSTYLHRGNAGVVQHGVVLDQTLELFKQLHPEISEAAQEQIRVLLKSKLPPFNTDTAPGLVPNVMTGRIANRLDLKGPNYLIDAACASSLLAVQAAVAELRAGRTDLMLAGGVNASIPAEVLMVFTQLRALSPNSRIRPFDAGADGTLLGEGLGVIVLKRLSDARRDCDRIYAVVKGVGQSSDGRGLGLLAPRLEGESLAIERAYRESGVDPRSITLLEAHGTGIPLGDKTEIEALCQVIGARAGTWPRCALGSVKSQISHCIPAAGIAGLIKTALALHHKVLPPTLCDEVNPDLEIEKTPFYINNETRPWVHPENRPRRAAIDAFGFGGINTHAILEEVPAGKIPHAALKCWESELAVFTADTRGELLAQVKQVMAVIEQHRKEIDHRCDNQSERRVASRATDVTLRDIAYTLAKDSGSGRQRLAVVATSLDDLAEKLGWAVSTLRDEKRHRVQTRKGVYFTDQPLAGKLAFLFPGEGAQYQTMLADLAIHFPAVREWFDYWDTIYESKRDFFPSSVVFTPPTGLEPAAREELKAHLYGLEIGSESVFIASQALFALYTALELKPDAMVGHSSGENTAMVAAGVVRIHGKEQLRGHILRLNKMYREIDSAGAVVTGSLMTVGAVEREKILEIIEKSQGQLHLALDNCQHQAVLFGPRELMDVAADQLRQEGGLCSYLPFDRAYHTRLFEPVSCAIEQFLEEVPFGPAKIPIYSCTSADLFPQTAGEIRRLAAAHWSSSVRFVETIERMYADGVRFFIEVGPSGNLTGFVGDILRGKKHLAVATNKRSHAGLLQLLHTLARVFVHGRSMNLHYLFEGRNVKDFTLRQPVSKSRKPLVALKNTLPYIRLEPSEIEQVRAILENHLGAAKQSTEATLPSPRTPPVIAFMEQEHVSTDYSPDEGAERGEVVKQHLELMQEFLCQQERVMRVSLGIAEGQQDWPFIERILSLDPDSATAEFDLNVAEQRFLQHHILYASQVSELDPNLHGLSVAPLAVSLEMMAEVAVLLSNRPYLVSLQDIRAYNWIALDNGEKTVRLTAERSASDDESERFHAALFEGEVLLLEGEVVFADRPLEAEASLAALKSPRESHWTDEQLYSTGMFHGPLFRSIRHLIGWDSGGIDAELGTTSTEGFFAGEQRLRFLLNPVLLDAVGHLTAFWIAQYLGTDFSCFPSQIRRIELVRAAEEATAGFTMRGRLAFVDGDGAQARFLEGRYDCLDTSGRALFRIEGWRDRFFSVPHRFYCARTNPREGWLGEDWSSLFPQFGPDALVWFVPRFPEGFLEDAGAIWKRVLAYTILNTEEREAWHGLTRNPARRNEWLFGRLALKEAVRRWAWARTGVLLFPADVLVRIGDSGKPYVVLPHLGGALDTAPAVSLAHVEGCAIAAVNTPDCLVGIDMETFGRIRLEDFVQSAFTAGERDVIAAAPEPEREAWALRLWCAKEAAAKCLGLKLNGRPQFFEVSTISPEGACAQVRVGTRELRVTIHLKEDWVIALALASATPAERLAVLGTA